MPETLSRHRMIIIKLNQYKKALGTTDQHGLNMPWLMRTAVAAILGRRRINTP